MPGLAQQLICNRIPDTTTVAMKTAGNESQQFVPKILNQQYNQLLMSTCLSRLNKEKVLS